MAYGLIPGQLGVSTESHIAGVVAGLFYAWCAKKLVRRKSQIIEVAK
jgi:membrane associated rhomboid family serine protease